MCDLTKPCLRTVHAEANVIAFAARYGLSTENTELFCTLSPCYDCTKLLINAGVKRVVYLEEYRDPNPITLLRQARVVCEKFEVSTLQPVEFLDPCLRLGTRIDER